MELSSLKGSIIGVVSDEYKNEEFNSKKVSEIIAKKPIESLKMVGLGAEYLDLSFNELSIRFQNKIILASKLHDKEIVLINFSKGMLKKDIEFFKNLFKKIVAYNRKIILIDKNSELFLNCVDKLYVINNDEIVYETDNLFDNNLSKYIDAPKIVEFVNTTLTKGIRINEYTEIDELLKAIYRIKS